MHKIAAPLAALAILLGVAACAPSPQGWKYEAFDNKVSGWFAEADDAVSGVIE